MKRKHLYVIGAIAAAGLVAWWLWPRRARTPTGDVELGIPTIDGILGGGRYGAGVDYFSDRDPSNPAIDPEMRRLIEESNRLIAAEGY